MNTRLVGLGVIFLIVALILGLYTSQDIIYAGQPGAESVVHQQPTPPYLTEAIVLAALGVVMIAAGLVIKKKRPSTNDEREGSLGIDLNDVRPPSPPPQS